MNNSPLTAEECVALKNAIKDAGFELEFWIKCLVENQKEIINLLKDIHHRIDNIDDQLFSHFR